MPLHARFYEKYNLKVPVGSVLLCEGEWKVDKRYGSQFVAQTWEEVMPATLYGIEKYLGSGLVKGIGPKYAQLIVSKFGLETIEVIETDIQRLYEVPGIGKKRVEKIQESWEKQKDIKNVMLFLQGYGVSTAYAAKIYRQYGKDSIDTVKGNPYRLADDIWGIGFQLPIIRNKNCTFTTDIPTLPIVNIMSMTHYDRYELGGFSEEAKHASRDAHWEEDLQKVYEAGQRFPCYSLF